jgi:radical SAM superfamily enzyme YgiQ (UPF0313 family)
MKVLLLYPKMPDTFYAMRHLLGWSGRRAAYPPLGLLTVASLLPERWERRLIDLNVRKLRDVDLRWPDLVFISAMNVQEESVREIIRQCKKAGVRMVAGGSLFTHEYEKFEGIDHFVLNEAEITLPEFIRDIEKGEAKPVYRTQEFPDITTTPLPDFNLIRQSDYLYSIIQYSRGCPFMCDFCDVTALYGRKPRLKTPGQIIGELEQISRKGDVRLVLFADDNLIGNKKHLKEELLPAMITWRKQVMPPFLFATQVSINLADDDELIRLMLEAGFRQLFIGIETPDEGSLQSASKSQNLKRNQMADIRKLHRAGFYLAGGFIVGFDTDTPSIFRRQGDFIQESGIPLPIVNILKAPPGTVLHQRLEKEGRLKQEFGFSEGSSNIIPVMDEKVLQDGFNSLLDQIYSPAGSYRRLQTFFSTYTYPVNGMKLPLKIGVSDLLMVIRVFLTFGIRYRSRRYFWKLLFWIARNYPNYVDMGFFYGIMIYQMHLTAEHIKKKNQTA